MKRVIKSRLFIFIISGIIFTNLGVYATIAYYAKDVLYISNDGKSVTVNDALDNLYSMKNELTNLKSLGDATEDDILEGKTAVVNGNLLTGTRKNTQSTFSGSFNAYHWGKDGDNYIAYSLYDITNYNKVKLKIYIDKPDGTILIKTNSKTLISTNCSNLASEYTFDVGSTDTTIYITRTFTYGNVTVNVYKA